MSTLAASENSTTDWDVAVGTGLLRIVVGTALLRWRDPVIRLSGGSPDDPWLRLLFTYFGARDVAVGVVTLVSTRGGADGRRVLVTHGAADTTDATVLAAVTGAGRLPRFRGSGLVGLAAGTAVVEYLAAARLRRARTG